MSSLHKQSPDLFYGELPDNNDSEEIENEQDDEEDSDENLIIFIICQFFCVWI